MIRCVQLAKGREDEMSDKELGEQTDNQDLLASYEITLDNLWEEYEAGLGEGIRQPSLKQLTKVFEIDWTE